MGNICCSEYSVKKLAKNKVIVMPAKTSRQNIPKNHQMSGSNKKILDGNYHEIRTIGVLNQELQRTVSLVSVNERVRGSSISEKQFKLFVMTCEKSVKYSKQFSHDLQLSTQNSTKVTQEIDLKAMYPLKYTYQDDGGCNQIYELQKKDDLPTYLQYINPQMMQFLLAVIVVKLEQNHIYDFKNLKAENILIDGNGYPAIMNEVDQTEGVTIWNLSLMDQFTSFMKITYNNQFITSGCYRQIHYERQGYSKNNDRQTNFRSLPSLLSNQSYHGKRLLQKMKQHEFFTGVKWDMIDSKQLKSPFLDIIVKHNLFNESIFNKNY